MRNTNLLQNESINLSHLNLTNEYSSLSPTNHTQNNMNNLSLIIKNNGLQNRIFRKNDNFASPTNNNDNIENIISTLGCQTVKSRDEGKKSFNLKIKLKNESSYKKL